MIQIVAPSRGFRRRALFICGSLNQTTQMHQVARHLRDWDCVFTPYYNDVLWQLPRRLRLIESTIGGNKLRARALAYLHRHGLPVDLDGAGGGYDLVVTCSDLVIPNNVRGNRIVAVQEGMVDPPNAMLPLVQSVRALPRWLAGTAATGLSGAYYRFCVASEGYRDLFIRRGAPAQRLVVTGIPNFDDCQRYRQNSFPHEGYALVCTSDARETFGRDDREAFLRRALAIAGDRELIVKLHPNERFERSAREVRRVAPRARVVQQGSAEEMVANCDVLVCQWSTLAFVGVALGKEVHSYFDLDELRALLPVQHGCAALNIARVCRESVGEAPALSLARAGEARR